MQTTTDWSYMFDARDENGVNIIEDIPFKCVLAGVHVPADPSVGAPDIWEDMECTDIYIIGRNRRGVRMENVDIPMPSWLKPYFDIWFSKVGYDYAMEKLDDVRHDERDEALIYRNDLSVRYFDYGSSLTDAQVDDMEEGG